MKNPAKSLSLYQKASHVQETANKPAVNFICSNLVINHLDFIKTHQKELNLTQVLPVDYDLGAHKEICIVQPGNVPITFTADCLTLQNNYCFKYNKTICKGLNRFVKWYAKLYQ